MGSRLKVTEKVCRFPYSVLRMCERATPERQKGRSCIATAALLQARLGFFIPVFDSGFVLVKFKRLIVSTLQMPPKSPICARMGCPLRISQAESPKRDN